MPVTLRLGIDVGTTGVRTAVIDPDGVCLSTMRSDHIAQGDTIDARLWWDAVAACVQRQVTELERLGHHGHAVTGIAVDGTSGSMVLTDEALAPVSPALMYNSKGFTAEAALIDRVAPGHTFAGKSNAGLARALRLVSLAQSAPTHLMHQADYIVAQFLGQGGLSDHSNALRTGFDPEAQDWPSWVTDVIDRGLLPSVQAVGTPYGRIRPSIATELGLSPDAVLYAGTTDSIAAFLAAAPQGVGAAVTSLGSTMAVYVRGKTRVEDVATGLHSHRIGDDWIVGGASNTGGAVLAHYFTGQDLRSLSGQIDPNLASPLDYYPLLATGERFPTNDPTLEPRLTPRPESDAAFLHGILDGIARIEARAYDVIEQRGGGRAAAVHSAGGGAHNAVWTAIRARRLNRPVYPAAQTQACIGVATLAKWH